MSHLRVRLSILVSVAVMFGMVTGHFGEKLVTFGSGESVLYADDGIPAALEGFKGMMSGTLVKKGDGALVFKVGKIMKTWKENKAEKPEAAVGETLTLSLERVTGHHKERIMKAYAEMKAGDAIEVEAFDEGGKRLYLKEWLKKAGAKEEPEGARD